MVRPLSELEMTWLTPRGRSARVALGAMNFGKRTSDEESQRIIARAIERGVTLLDTANTYNAGESERVVGRAIKGRRDSLLVATKVGLDRVGGRPEGLSRAAIHRAIEGSLERLGTDYVDIYYLHAPDHGTPIEETMDAIAELVHRGVIRHLGISNYASWQILEIMRLCDERSIGRPRVSQVIYNLLVRQIELEYLRFARKYPLHTTVYNPLAGGLLAGRYKQGDAISPGSRFDKNGMYQKRYWTPPLFDAAAKFGALAEAHGMSLVDLSYAWLATAPGVDSILVGPASLPHLDAAIDACNLPLAANVRAAANALYEAWTGTDVSYAR